VRSSMSEPFLANYRANDVFSAQFAVQSMLDVLAGLTPEQSGRTFAWDGEEIAP
jgi:hypothetical protein